MVSMNGAFGRRKPVGLLVGSGRIGLDVDGQSAVAIELEMRQHRRVDKVAVDRVLHEKLAGQVVHGQRPEGVDGRKLSFGKAQRVVGFAAVERLAVGVLV